MAALNGKKKIAIIVSVVALVTVIIGGVAVTEIFSYACADCENMVYFKEYVIPSEDGDGGRCVCQECIQKWEYEEFGIKRGGERIY
ncbi:MAG: hypothetical protein IJ025_00330 [Clostridia bacterium]|nr:hypothetical protein [Clostridia bacterium]